MSVHHQPTSHLRHDNVVRLELKGHQLDGRDVRILSHDVNCTSASVMIALALDGSGRTPVKPRNLKQIAA